MPWFREFVQRMLAPFGYQVVRSIPRDFASEERELYRRVEPYTLTSPERILACYRAAEYVVQHDIPGEIVECGVWRGGSMMAMALALLRLRRVDRHLYLFDTFEGMPPPGTADRDFRGVTAATQLRHARSRGEKIWAYAPLEAVREAVLGTGYDPALVHFVQGRIEDTVPAQAPDQISLLRLDTDWYESTRHELTHLYPRLARGGVLIIDDYGHWQGARQATDEYLLAHRLPLLLNRIDYTGRIAVKP